MKREPIAPKVPEITALFWLIKVLTTGMGEATSDYLGNTNLVLAGLVCALVFPFSLWLQFRVQRYYAPIYWFAVMMVAVFGTVVADGLHVGLKVPYIGSSLLYAAIVGYLFRRWYRSEGTLSIHSIVTRKRETYYWWTVLLTFALGTALGDLTAAELNLGFFASIIIFAAIMVVPAIGWWKFKMNEVAAFWFAYIVTRPLGASVADWLGKPHRISGLGYGDGVVSGIAFVAIAVLVAYVAIRRNDIQGSPVDEPLPLALPQLPVLEPR